MVLFALLKVQGMEIDMRQIVIPLSCSALMAAHPAFAQLSPGSGPITAESVIYEPAELTPTEDRLQALNLPEGFSIEVFAEDLGEPRMIAVSEIGNVYVTRRTEGDLLMLGDGDGEAIAPQTVLELEDIHGIYIQGATMYLATIEEIYTAPINNDGSLGDLELIVDDLPAGGQHPNRTLAIGPDGLLYVSVGSTCNACSEPDDEHATLLRMPITGADSVAREIFADGLRNTIGFAWRPDTGELWGVDHGSDMRGSAQPPEELNLIVQGNHYGWPWCYGDREVDAFIPGIPEEFDSKDAFCATTEAPVLTYASHASPLQLVVYQAEQFPEEYRGDIFQSMRGSWNADPPAGYEITRIRFENGAPVSWEPFITGFLVEEGDGHGQFGRPTGLAVTPEGALLIGDNHNGVIYRVTYEGQEGPD